MKILRLKSAFSTLADTANVRITLKDPFTGQLNDQNLDRYDSVFASYLYKRRITKDQISPKIHIIQPKTQQQKPHLNYQSLYPLKVGMDQQLMQKLIKEDPSALNSNYVISIFCQNNFKQMMDQYVDKVLICGKAPKNYQQQQEVEQKVQDLFKVYHFGQEITPLQREIELKYLSVKQKKYIKYITITRGGARNAFNRCLWRQQDQKILEDFANWHRDNFDKDDINFRPFFQPLYLTDRLNSVRKLYSLMGTGSFLDAINFKRQIKPFYQKSSQYYQFLTQKIYLRVNYWVNSVQFTSLLKIPPDYLIEQSIKQIHIWLIASRLQQIGTPTSKYLGTLLIQLLKKDISNQSQTKTVRKSQILVNSINKMLMNNNQFLQMHFRRSNITKNNHYKGIDALVWTIAYSQKVQRYSDMVYLFSQYLIKNYKMIQNLSQEDISNGLIQFDAYLVDPKYKQIILKINPQLSKEDFQNEFNSDKTNKKYYYSQIQKGVQMPIQFLKQRAKRNQISFKELILLPIYKLMRKYTNLQTMDFFNQLQKQQKQLKQKDKKSSWKTETDSLNQVKKDFKQLDTLRQKRKNHSNISAKQNK